MHMSQCESPLVADIVARGFLPLERRTDLLKFIAQQLAANLVSF